MSVLKPKMNNSNNGKPDMTTDTSSKPTMLSSSVGTSAAYTVTSGGNITPPKEPVTTTGAKSAAAAAAVASSPQNASKVIIPMNPTNPTVVASLPEDVVNSVSNGSNNNVPFTGEPGMHPGDFQNGVQNNVGGPVGPAAPAATMTLHQRFHAWLAGFIPEAMVSYTEFGIVGGVASVVGYFGYKRIWKKKLKRRF